MKKNIIIGIIIGIAVTVFSYHAYTVYKLKAYVAQHEEVLKQIVGIINSNIKK